MNESPAHLRDILAQAGRGELNPPMALMTLLTESVTSEQARTALDQALTAGEPAAAARLAAVDRLWAENPRAWEVVRAVLDPLDHEKGAPTPEAGIARWAELFDRAARISPEASVALYSFGNPALLDAQTAEIVAAMRGWGLIAGDAHVLEIGCGIGRFCAALAPEVARITGVDISGEMIEQSRRRCMGLANVELRQTSGRDLGGFEDRAFDLVLAADSFPYLVDAGLEVAETHIREAARVLRPGGELLLLNFSYRGDAALDAADAARLAESAGMTQVQSGVQPFELWNGTVFRFRNAGAEAR